MNRSLSAPRLAQLLGEFPRTPAYRGLRDALQQRIGDGRIALGTRLPSERDASIALGVSRNTVARAYSDLTAAGFASARQGAGTFTTVPESHRRAHDHVLHSLGAAPSDAVIDLTCAAAGAGQEIGAAYARALEALPAYLHTDGYLPTGLPALRESIAARFARRGLPTDAGQVIVTSGALSALSIVARALSRPGDRITIEAPGYANALEALRLGGGRLVASPMGDVFDDAGWDLDGIEATLRQTAPRLAYLMPDFHNPTGLLMDDGLRERYAGALQATGTVAVVDETLQPTSLGGMAMPAPFALHAADALTIGSASKLCWGGLRVGWIRAPRELVSRIVSARVRMDLGTSLFDQLVVTELLQGDDPFAPQREPTRRRRDALATALRAQLPDWRFRLPEGGLTLWVQLPRAGATRLAAAVEREGLHVVPGPVFSVDGGFDDWLRIPYAKPETQLLEAVARLAAAWNALPDDSRRQRARSPYVVA
jgi:DNA-binding transcriptional MocR family regulator